MQFQRKTEVVEAIQLTEDMGAASKGVWIVRGEDGHVRAIADSEFTPHFQPTQATTTTGRRLTTTQRTTKARETLTVPTAHARLNPRSKGISDKVLHAIGTTPMNAAAIAEMAHIPAKQLDRVRTVLSRLAKSGAVHTKKGSGLYAAVGR